MKYLLLITLLCLALPLSAKEDCTPLAIGLDENSNIAVKLYYTGTCHYRNNDYKLTAKKWQLLAQLQQVSTEYEELQ